MDKDLTRDALLKRLEVLEQENREFRKRVGEYQEKHERILESIEEGYYELDLKGNIVSFNKVAGSLLGYKPDELRGKNYRDYTSPETARRMYGIFRRIYETGSPERLVNYEVINRDGSVHAHEMSAGLMRDAAGEPAGFRVLVHDITARRHAEELLKKSEERYRSILETMEEAYYEVDLKGNFTFFNSRAMNRLGYTIKELSGLNYRQYMDESNAQKVYEAYHRVFLTGEPIIGVEWELRDRQGQPIFVEASVSLRHDASGKPVGFRGVVRDVTERKQAEKALKASEERWQFALEGAGDGLWDYDVENQRVYRSRRWKEMLGYAEDEVTESPDEWTRLVHPDDRQQADDELARHIRGETPVYIHEHRIRCSDGTYQWILDRGKIISRSGDGSPLRIIGTQTDITECKQAEKALKDSERKYRLLAENLRDVIWILDADLKYVYVSPSVMQLRGYTPEEVMRQTMDQVLAPESYQKAVELFTQGQVLEFSGRKHGKDWKMNLDLEMVRKDGSTVWTEVTLNILYDENGSPEGLLGITHDISDRRKAEEAVRESEERYRSLFDGMMDGMYRSTHEGRFVDINQAMVDMFGYSSKEEMLQIDVTKELYFVPEDRGSHILDTGQQETALYRMRRKDASEIWVEDHGRYVHDEQGRVLFHEGTLRDVTDRKKGEEAIRESEERYRTIFESTATANIIVAEDTTIILANSNFERLAGYSREEMEGRMSWTFFVVEGDLEIMKQRHIQRRTDPGSAPSVYEFRARVRSGEVRNLYMSVSVIPDTRESVASIIDMTDRKKAEDALKASEERFRDLARLLPETVFETDIQGNFTFVNEISLELFGVSEQEVENGINILDVIAPQDHERATENYQRVIQGERLGLSEYTARRKDGTTFPALIHTTPIYRSGAYIGLRGFLIDISEKKGLEEQLMRAKKLESIGTLAGGIAHDFNNLLMGILGNISLMLMHLDEGHPFHDRLKSMEEYVQRGSDLTKQLLGFARGGKYEVKSTDLGEFVRRSAEMFGRTKKEIRMHHKASENLWPVEVDRGQMEQVMLNLFVNAWQAMPGGGDVYLSVENAELGAEDVSPYEINPGRFVKLTVMDTGVGMDEDTRIRIFEPFFSTKERGRGTGLGLASVYGIIKNHGGFILVESEKDVGTSFMVFLPASMKEVEAEKTVAELVHKGRETVLLIDDEEMIIDVGARMLEGLGYSVLTARGGRQGLQIYGENKGTIDFVILDMIMPDMGGKETFDAMLRLDPDVKVLLSSGYSLDGQAKDIMARGCKGFIQKPFTMAELSHRIREVLETV